MCLFRSLFDLSLVEPDDPNVHDRLTSLVVKNQPRSITNNKYSVVVVQVSSCFTLFKNHLGHIILKD